MLHFNVTGEPIPPWAVGVDPVPEQRGPPADHDVVDPPTPDEYGPRADRSALRDLGRGRAEVRPHIPSEAGSDRNMGASRVPCVGAQEGFAMWMRLRGLATPPRFEAEPIRNARPAKSDPATYAIRRPESERAHDQRLLRDHRPNVLRRASPSHFHVYCGSHDVVVRIDTLEIVDGALPRRARAWFWSGRRSTGPS
jgi:hypothetical protein